MAIKFSIFQTRLRGGFQSLGRVILQGCYDRDAVVGRMLSMGTTLTKTDIAAVLELFGSAIEQICGEGFKVNIDGLIHVTPAIGGEFNDKADTFTVPRNTVYLTAQVSKALNERVALAATVEKVIVDENRPILNNVADSEADPGATALVMGKIMSVSGKRLKFDHSQTNEYLRLVNALNPTEFVSVTKFHKVSDQELVFRLPTAAFTAGYFEVASSLNTATIRLGRSPVFAIKTA